MACVKGKSGWVCDDCVTQLAANGEYHKVQHIKYKRKPAAASPAKTRKHEKLAVARAAATATTYTATLEYTQSFNANDFYRDHCDHPPVPPNDVLCGVSLKLPSPEPGLDVSDHERGEIGPQAKPNTTPAQPRISWGEHYSD